MNVYLDFRPNLLKSEQGREELKRTLRERFEQDLSDVVERLGELPPMMLLKPDGEYLSILLETRNLYIEGAFYACVAMSGIVGERLVKDLLRISLLVRRDRGSEVPSEKSFDQLERVDQSAITRFLKEAAILSSNAAKAANDLIELRNKYAHARGRQPKEDALSAIKLLHVIIEDTVSVFKQYEIREGSLVKIEKV